MKKKNLCFAVMLLIIVNVFLYPLTETKKQSQFSLTLLEARADGDGETDPTDPGEEYPPLRPIPSDWTMSAMLDYLF